MQEPILTMEERTQVEAEGFNAPGAAVVAGCTVPQFRKLCQMFDIRPSQPVRGKTRLRYRVQDVMYVIGVRRLQRAGMSLDEVGRYLRFIESKVSELGADRVETGVFVFPLDKSAAPSFFPKEAEREGLLQLQRFSEMGITAIVFTFRVAAKEGYDRIACWFRGQEYDELIAQRVKNVDVASVETARAEIHEILK